MKKLLPEKWKKLIQFDEDKVFDAATKQKPFEPSNQFHVGARWQHSKNENFLGDLLVILIEARAVCEHYSIWLEQTQDYKNSALHKMVVKIDSFLERGTDGKI